MRRISRMVIGAAASTALLGGIGGAVLTAVPTGTTAATAIEYATSGTVPICNPTAIEYGTSVGCPGT
jgi:hypothetical protein